MASKFDKMVKEQQHQFKLKLLEQICLSLEMVFGENKEDEVDSKAWIEEFDKKQLSFKKIEFSKQFGIVHLHYVDENNKDQNYRLSLELKRV